MIGIDEFEIMLNEIAINLPKELYVELNGGINLRPYAKPHPNAVNGDLLIMGEYCNYNDLGRFINIYYGSFLRVCNSYPYHELRKKLESVLKHEFLHHMESLAGEKELEIEDALFIESYINTAKEKLNPKD